MGRRAAITGTHRVLHQRDLQEGRSETIRWWVRGVDGQILDHLRHSLWNCVYPFSSPFQAPQWLGELLASNNVRPLLQTQ
jgi:hypothetical protein